MDEITTNIPNAGLGGVGQCLDDKIQSHTGEIGSSDHTGDIGSRGDGSMKAGGDDGITNLPNEGLGGVGCGIPKPCRNGLGFQSASTNNGGGGVVSGAHSKGMWGGDHASIVSFSGIWMMSRPSWLMRWASLLNSLTVLLRLSRIEAS